MVNVTKDTIKTDARINKSFFMGLGLRLIINLKTGASYLKYFINEISIQTSFIQTANDNNGYSM
jgi:hypothetical protein